MKIVILGIFFIFLQYVSWAEDEILLNQIFLWRILTQSSISPWNKNPGTNDQI